jgi:hypothetical protein
METKVKNDPVVAIAGVTGAVGAEFIATMDNRGFRVGKLKALASARSAGKTLDFRGRTIMIEELDENSFEGVDIALFSAGGGISRKFAPIAVKAGAVVVDNSSAFRMDPDVPLVIPEINAIRIREHKGIIAVPNCAAITALVPLWPIHRNNRIKRVILSTYQAASGAGAAAMEELVESTRASLNGQAYPPKVMPYPYAFNLFNHNTAVDPATGYNDEETKVIRGNPEDIRRRQHCRRRDLRARAGAACALRGHHLRMRKADYGERGARDPVECTRREDRGRPDKELFSDADRCLGPGRRSGWPHSPGSQRSHRPFDLDVRRGGPVVEGSGVERDPDRGIAASARDGLSRRAPLACLKQDPLHSVYPPGCGNRLFAKVNVIPMAGGHLNRRPPVHQNLAASVSRTASGSAG